MRKAHKEILIKVNLLVPVNLETLKNLMKEDSCFGKEWDPQTSECSVCASAEICGILTGELLKTKKKEGGPYLDEVTVDIDWDSITDLIREQEGLENPISVADLFERVKQDTKSKDKKLIIAMLKKYIKGNTNIYTKDNVVRFRL